MKKIIALLLALSMCLCFVACGETEDDEPSKGEKLYKKYKELISCLEDSDYSGAYEILVNLAGEGFSSGDSGSMDFGAYEDIFNYLNNENYSAAINAIVRLENEKNQAEPTDLMTLLCNTWYGGSYSREEMPTETSVSFNADGTCTVREQTLNWSIDWQGEWDMSLKLYNEGTQVGSAYLQMSESGVAYLSIYDSVEEINLGYFYQHSLLSHLYSAGWYIVDETTEGMGDYFSVGHNQFYYNSKDYDCRIVSEIGNEPLVVHAFDKNQDSPAFIVTLYKRDGRFVTDLTDTANNTTALYYNEYTGGRSTEWPEYIYSLANLYLQVVIEGGGTYVDGEYLRDNALRAKVYELFNKCSGYKDADKFLANFKVLKDMPTKTVGQTIDNLGNENSSTWSSYIYDSQGRLTRCNGYTLVSILMGSASSNLFFHYDEAGRISVINYGWSESDLSAILTPIYNEAGVITAIEIKNNSGTRTNYFTCDEAGRLLRADYSTNDKDKAYYSVYTYDDAGKLLKVEGVNSSGYEFETIYTYDENGHVDTKTENVYASRYHNWYDDEYTVYDFTCDEEGDPISAVITGSDYESYASVTLNYIYEDLYFYEP